MKNPNGYGSVSKMSGNRRRPWRVRTTVGWRWWDKVVGVYVDEPGDDMSRYSMRQNSKTIGYFRTRAEAQQALAEYNADPYDLNGVSYKKIYEAWSEQHYKKIKASGQYVSAFNNTEILWDMKISEIRLSDLQNALTIKPLSHSGIRTIKLLWGMMWEYAARYDAIPLQNKELPKLVDIDGLGSQVKSNKRKIYTADEIDLLWSKSNITEAKILLIMIYTGVRISELLDLDKNEVNLSEQYFDILEAKTKAGVRSVPIADKILPLFEYFMNNGSKYLFPNKIGGRMNYQNLVSNYFKTFMEAHGLHHTPHDTRHTCITMLTQVGVDDRVIKAIVGHAGASVTENIYTHIDIKSKLDAVNRL